MSDYRLYLGDCLDVMPALDSDSVDTIITDPPYGLSFMGKDWDHGVPGQRFWREALRVAKPGAMLLAFGGTRTHHRLMVAIEDAGWEIRDVVMWVYGSGFPKSHNIGKSTKHKQWHGYGTALKPAWEPIIVAMKPLDGTFANNALTHGVAGLWIDGARVPANGDVMRRANNVTIGGNGIYQGGKAHVTGAADGRRWPANLIHDGSDEVVGLFPVTSSGKLSPENNVSESTGWSGGSYADRVKSTFEANSGSAARFFYCAKASRRERNAGLEGMTNRHPTVKPIALMRYLARLTKTPQGGVVLDPFMGSGSTGIAALLEGRSFIGIEMDADYLRIAERRIVHHWQKAREERAEPRQLELVP